MADYQIRLTLTQKIGGYVAKWIESDGNEYEPFDLVQPLTPDNKKELRWYLEEHFQYNGPGDKAAAQQTERNLEQWGGALFKAAFPDGIGTQVYNNLLNHTKDGTHCLITIGSKDCAILSQPWEMMRNSRGPLVFQGATIRRQMIGVDPPKALQFQLPLRVLLIVSRPTDTHFIDPRNSIPPILDAMDAMPSRQAKVDFCDPPTLSRLDQMLSDAQEKGEPYHIVHFDGHGTYMPVTGVGALCFEGADYKTDYVLGNQLGDLLAGYNIPLVLLEACRGADLSDKPIFGSVAPALQKSGVGSVIAFSHSVHVKAAKLLVERFYKELTQRRTIGKALEKARASMLADRKRWLHRGPGAKYIELQDWFIPQLYQTGNDIALFVDGEAGEENGASATVDPRAERRREIMKSFPPPPMYKFHGRAMELLEMERAFRKYNVVLLSGMGGMGKTALAREAADWRLRTGQIEAAVFCSFERGGGAERVVQEIGRALEGESFASRSAEDQWKTAVSLFQSRRVLVVWDNFESTLPQYQKDTDGTESPLSFGADARARLQELFRDLTENRAEGRLLVTCRPEATGLAPIKEIALSGLARPDSLHLLAAICDLKGISTEREGYERHEIDELLKLLQDHPLSIELIAPHLRDLKPETVRQRFRELMGQWKNKDAFFDRNKSLLASLAFSKDQLSPEAQKALPFLAWFEGGVFEQFFLAFTEYDPREWETIRNQLTATALVKVENYPYFNSPYLRFHPTLPFAADPYEVADPQKTEERFIGVYQEISQIIDNALRGKQPALAMMHAGLEEANLRKAIALAFQRGERHPAWSIADTLGVYLQMAGRLRERDQLVRWVNENLGDETLDEAACASILDQSWSLFTQGQAAEAVAMVQNLIERLEREELADKNDTTRQLALSNTYLGRIYVECGHSRLAIEPLQKSVTLFEQLGDAQRDNLSAALGGMSNAYRTLGNYEEALQAAERGLEIYRVLKNDREISVDLARIAQIFMDQQRYAEADQRYREALQAAQAAGDLEVQGTILQHQGILQNQIGNNDRAVELYNQAIGLYQRANNTLGEMQTCNLLANVEKDRQHFESAQAWYDRSRELAIQLKDRQGLAIIAQNQGILYQTQAEQTDDQEKRDSLLQQAIQSMKESLDIEIEMQNQIGAAASYGQLSIFYIKIGDLDAAEENAKQALAIHEPLDLPEVYKDYNSLAQIARARGDEGAAAEWQAKRDAKVAELEKLRRGGAEGEAPEPSKEIVEAVLGLAQVAFNARGSGAKLPPDAAEALAAIDENWPEPANAIAGYLRAFAEGEPVAIPGGLPEAFHQILQAMEGQWRGNG